MKKKRQTFSVIIPYKKKTPYLYESLENLSKLTIDDFEVILLPDKNEKVSYKKARVIPTGPVGPAKKRDIGAEKAKGDILAFIDDDAYPHPDWLKNLVKHFENPTIGGVGGPGVIPPKVSFWEEASGWVSASPLGGGLYTYRFIPGKVKVIDDYPSMNLSVRREDFLKVGGFDSHYWPGEDTKLCLDLVYKLGKKIIYDPKVLVYHHRRPLWRQHLKQNGNYGLHRGYFAKALPKTSFRLFYFLPSFLVLGIIILPKWVIPSYGILLLLNALWIGVISGSFLHAVVSIGAVFLTHLFYGIRFIQGFFFTKKLSR